MAALVDTAMGALNEARKPMYPLFDKSQKPIQPQSKKTDPSAQQATPQETTISDPPLSKASSGENQNARNPTILDSSNAGRSDKPPTVAAPGIGDAELLEVDLNHDRRKRKRTVSPRGDGERPSYQQQSLPNFLSKTMVNTIEANSVVTVIADEVPQEKSSDVDPERFLLVDKPPSTQTQQIRKTSAIDLSHVASISSRPDKLDQSVDGDPAYSSKEGPAATKTQAGNDETKPKRILRLNPKTGTIGSPPAKQKEPQIETVGRKARPSRSNQRISKFVIIRYGHGTNLPSELGTKIGKILRGSETVSSLTARSSTANEKSKNRKVIGANPGAAPHPFFLGKAAAKPSAAQEVILPVSDVTGIAQSKELMTLELAGSKPPKRPAPSKSSVSRFTGFGGNAAKILKFPGAVEPAWPWKGMTHVRGSNGILDGPQLPSNGLSGLLSRRKKSKYQAVEVLASEDVISALATELCITQLVKNVREINLDEYPPVAACLRIPDRHFASGRDIQERVRKELSTQLPAPKAHTEENTSEDEIQGTGFKHGLVHPALATIYNTISTSLSAFDQSRCETQSWCHKYSPKATAEVLQTGREVQIIKEWLQTLIVKSVETGVGDRSHSRASSVSRRSTATGKRKHRSKKLDGFVVSSDEEEDDLDEISETDEDASPHSSQGLLKRTVVRAGNAASKGSTRLTNAVVVSGPHGCGKTAAIYAVAKELGFEVFEINSSSRRSGKDILEKVGDMTHNHLVQGSHDQTLAEPVDEDARRIADALEDDLKSGRQGTMNSFFKPKESATAKSQPKVISTGTPKSGTSIFTAPPRASSRQQKQSLILFEEVDVLYDEDKQFWATVINMIAQSKRPVIMTCTDESTVPFISLTLHAIIRFTPPPIDLATDYMLLVAASEGHLIRREAVKALYESRRQDLRASLMELNFWCQFAVGDNKGGLEWLYTRWPPGVDIDDNGRIIRVISDSAYETGMGWLCQDFLESHLSHVDIEEETMHEAWEGWHLDVGDWRQTLNVSAWANKMQSQSRGKGDGANSLRIYDEFLDAISAADLCSGGTFAPDNEIPLDATLPAMSSKVREDYTVSQELLEAAPLVSFETTGLDISFWMKSRARKYLQVDQHVKYGFEIPPELGHPSEARIIELIRSKACYPESRLIRQDFSLAFDPISEPEKTSLYSTGQLEASSFDRSLALIATDIAPYVRSIVSYDVRLQQDRTRLSNLMSEGGRRGKRVRTTRSAMSALEGGARSTTRRDRYFGPGLNPHFVLKTGMQSWLAAVLAETDILSREDNETESGADEMMEDSQ